MSVQSREIITRSEEETFFLAQKIGKDAAPGSLFALFGDLGTGKTIIAKGIAAGMGITEDITSPTFTLMEVYKGPLTLYHFDLYRIESDLEFDNLFFEEYWEDEGVSVIEWPEKAGTRLPGDTTKIKIDYIDENSRRIVIEYPGT
ncbi:MAG: tRNA (adenosine(37)-N6)-threonylcarbamoyltransferase complex ATPase subunit type 1 TsaE [bacterium]|nr:tRNA (adenosine(37)-N6)-threonylcarbamoyltransferase complex ATPase subunit type 1 TsaE [bacterium]